MHRLTVFISGRGSNMQALHGACQRGALPATVAAVICDQPGAAGAQWAQQQGIATHIVERAAYASKADHEAALLAAVPRDSRLILLAGFMRVLSAEFIAAAPAPILNIHPSRLPLFKGLNTHRQALAAGVKEHGASVHIVTAALDDGPVILQSRVAVKADDTEERLAARVLATEHPLYIAAVGQLLGHKPDTAPCRPEGHPESSQKS